MPKYPLIHIRLPKQATGPAELAAFSEVAKRHGYLTDYHSNTEHGSPGLLIMAINGGEVVTAPFEPEWYDKALTALAPYVERRDSWAESLSVSIRAAQERAKEYKPVDEDENDDSQSQLKPGNEE